MKVSNVHFHKELNCAVEFEGDSYSFNWRGDSKNCSIFKIIGGVYIPKDSPLHKKIVKFVKSIVPEIE